MKIELKKIKIAEHMSEETTAFTAEIYINGVNAGYAKNDGRGGCTDYHPYEGKRSLIQAAEKHCLTLPAQKIDMGEGRKPLVIEMNLENFIDDLVHEELKRRDQKKFEKQLEKRMEKSIMWGIPNGNSYREIRQKQPLSAYNVTALQGLVDRVKKDFKAGEQFLNTNFEKLGIKI
jgi:hypothetical protein